VRRLIVLTVVGLVVAVLVVAQLVLPGIAAQQLRDRLARSGQVLEVQVHAFPALELLWHHADSVVIRLGSYRSGSAALGSNLDQTSDVGSLRASVGELDTGLLTLRDATLVKHGSQLTGNATVTEADLRRALPILQSVTPVASGDGQLTLRGTATLLGVTASVDATVRAQDGQLVVLPDVPFGGLATITVFSNPHLSVESVGASPAPGGFLVRGTAALQ
jgi:hypothetical protein